jgi:hypothetical protein
MAAMRPRKPFVQRETSRYGKVVRYFRRGDGPGSGFPATTRAAIGGARRYLIVDHPMIFASVKASGGGKPLRGAASLEEGTSESPPK